MSTHNRVLTSAIVLTLLLCLTCSFDFKSKMNYTVSRTITNLEYSLSQNRLLFIHNDPADYGFTVLDGYTLKVLDYQSIGS